MNKLLSVNDIQRLVNKPIRFVKYDDLVKMKSYKDLFKGYDCILLLYNDPNINPNVGHWVGLKRFKNDVNFFDSYGTKPDETLKEISYNYNNELCRLLLDSPYNIHYNPVKLQSDTTQVCGRYVALFFHYCEDNVDDFVKKLEKMAKDKGITTDQLVVELTLI